MKTFTQLVAALLLTGILANASDAFAGVRPSSKELTDKQVSDTIGKALKGKDAKTLIPKIKKKFNKDVEEVTKLMGQAALRGDVASLRGYQNTLVNLGKALKELDKRQKELGGVVLLGIGDAGIARD